MTGVLKLRSERMLREQKKLVADLKKALADVRTLQGILPICAACKQVRDDNGYWKQVEKYIEEHSEARFTHGICPDCAKRLYPELYEGRDIDPSLIT